MLIFLNQETSGGDRNRFIATQLDRGEGRCCGKGWHGWFRDDFEVVGSIPSTLNIFMPNLDFLGYFGVTQSLVRTCRKMSYALVFSHKSAFEAL